MTSHRRPSVNDPPRRSTLQQSTLQSLSAQLATALAFGVLVIGAISPDPRLTIGSIPLNTVFMIAAFIAAGVVPCLPGTRTSIGILLAPVFLLGLTLIWSPDAIGGFAKLGNLLLSTSVAAILLAAGVQRLGEQRVVRILIVYLVALLGAALLYKLHAGFLDRKIPFLFNGPIVFARLMGIGCIAAVFALRGLPRVVIASAFALAVVWTASKGPVVSLAIALVALSVRGASPKRLAIAIVASALIAVALISVGQSLLNFKPIARMWAATDFLSAPENGGMSSVASRLFLYERTSELIIAKPLGVGVGGWSAATGVEWVQYPHNIELEVWSEGGLILGTIALIGFYLPLFRRRDVWWGIVCYLCFAQQVSGDLQDARYWLAFGLVGFVVPSIPRIPSLVCWRSAHCKS